MTTVRLHMQDLQARLQHAQHFFEADWTLPRNHVCTYVTEAQGSNAAEQAFHMFNAPEHMLDPWQVCIVQSYTGPSLSVGDVVQVNAVEYLCCSAGWQSRDCASLYNPVASHKHQELEQPKTKTFRAQVFDC